MTETLWFASGPGPHVLTRGVFSGRKIANMSAPNTGRHQWTYRYPRAEGFEESRPVLHGINTQTVLAAEQRMGLGGGGRARDLAARAPDVWSRFRR